MHGGDIYRNKVELDFSVSVNPLGLPKSIKRAWKELRRECSVYPDLEQEELKRAIQSMTKADTEHILCGNGATELFGALIRTVPVGKKIFIPVPAFSGYEHAARAGEREVICYTCKKENGFCPDMEMLDALSEEIGMVILANPNNPVGNLPDPFFLEKLIRICRDRGILVVLDESFIEFVRGNKKISFLKKAEEYANLVIVRSFTKIFALPGLRLGYLVCADPALKKRIETFLPEWNVSALAQRAGILAAAEGKYQKRSRRLVEKERAYLMKELAAFGFSVYPGEANYLLFYTELKIAEKLLERGILIRDCSDFRGLTKGYYRIAVKIRKENDRLLKALGEIVCG